MSRLVGAKTTPEAGLAIDLYSSIVQAEFVITDWETAEVIKTAENAARDVQIALANQLAVISDYAGVDFRKVRDQINQLWRTEPLIMEAGPGVGGHCLPKDPWLLISALPLEAPANLILGARALNESMPQHACRIAEWMCVRNSLPLASVTAAVLGLTYDADTDDQRNAVGPIIAELLRKRVGEVVTHDPYITGGSLAHILRDADILLVVVPHREYKQENWGALGSLMRHRGFLDCRRVFEADALRASGYDYVGLGLGALDGRRD
jgi:UDP-N-acetyl-D-mannosaminuronic acid dehydrogenase